LDLKLLRNSQALALTLVLFFHATARCVRTLVSVDPMRVVTVPNTVNGKTGLIYTFIGSARDLERLTISEILDKSKTFPQSYPEPLESNPSKDSCNGAMKSCAKNRVGAAL
jgi:hypothetical protein